MKDFQKEQLENLRSKSNNAYKEAPVYTILYDLVDGNGLDEVFMILHMLAHDLDKSDELDKEIELSKNWIWS